ncbi:MAG: type II secretion system protein [Candidatus Acidiferrales bacterium]
MSRQMARGASGDSCGFTLLELMIVMAIILILATIGAGRFEQSIIRSHEAALKQDLFVMRNAIQQYTLDKEAGPNSLDDLVSSGYLREIPRDPITKQKDWATSSDDLLASPDQTTVGITDVHSTSSDVSPFENTPYSSW